MDPPAILVERARKTYSGSGGRKEAVRDVSFHVMPGTIHGLLGPNGAGKTTTLKMLMGLVRPDAGVLEIQGRPAAEPASRAGVGFLPEQPYFTPQLTAAQVINLYGALCGLEAGSVRRDTSALLARVGLEGTERTQLSAFSRGMLQRLGLAQALLGEPKVLVLDEPASGLDPVGQRDIRNLMLEMRGSGTAVLLSSHQLSEVEAVCDRVTILHRGAVAAEGPLDELLNFAGRTSVRVRDVGDRLPPGVEQMVEEVAVSGGTWVFSVADEDVRRVVDSIDDAGGRIEALTPKRDTLEDYFSRLLSSGEGGENR